MLPTNTNPRQQNPQQQLSMHLEVNATTGGEWSGNPQEHEIFSTMYNSSQSLPGSPSLDTFLENFQLEEMDNLAYSHLNRMSEKPTDDQTASQWLNGFTNNAHCHRVHYFEQTHSSIALYLPDYPYPVFLFNLGFLNNISQQISVDESKRMLNMALPQLEIATLFNSEVIVTDANYSNTSTYPTIYLDIPLPSSYNGLLRKYIPETLPTFKSLRESYSLQRSVPLTLDIERAFKLAQAVPYFHGHKRSTLATQVLKECYCCEPQSLYVYCMIYMCLFGQTFQPNGKEVSALDLIIRQALFECTTIDAIVLLRASIKLLEFPENVKGNWVKVSAREFHSVKMKILEYIDDKFTRMFYKLFNSPESDLLNYSSFLLIANLVRSSRLVVDDENQVLRALRQYLIINADVIIAEKSRMAVPEQIVEKIQQIPIAREIYAQRKLIPKKQIEVFQERNGRIFFRISRYAQLVEDAICYMIAGLRWHYFGDNALAMLQYLYEDLNHVGIFTEFSFDTFCYLVESHRDPGTLLNRTIKNVGVGKGINRQLSQNCMTFKSSSGNGVSYPKEIMLTYNCFDNRHYFQTFHLSSIGKGVRMNELATFTRYHAVRMREHRVINRFLAFDMRIFQSFIRDIDTIPANKFDRILMKAHVNYNETLASSHNVINRHNNLLANCENKYRNGYVHDCVMPYNFNQLIQLLKKQVFAMLHPQFMKRLNKDIDGPAPNAKKTRRQSRADIAVDPNQNIFHFNFTLGNTNTQGEGQGQDDAPVMQPVPTPTIIVQAQPMMNVLNSKNNHTSQILATHNSNMFMSQIGSNSGCNSVQSSSSSGCQASSSNSKPNAKQGQKRGRQEFRFVLEDGINSTSVRSGRRGSTQGQLTLEQQARENAELLSLNGSSVTRTVELNVHQVTNPYASNFQVPTTTFRPKHFVNFLVYKSTDEFRCSSPNVGTPELILDEIELPLYICRPAHISPSKYLDMMSLSSMFHLNMKSFFDLLKADEKNVKFPADMRANGIPQRDANDDTLQFNSDSQKDPLDIDWRFFNVDAFCERVNQDEMKKQQHYQEVYMQQVMMRQFDMMQNQDEGTSGSSVFDLLLTSPGPMTTQNGDEQELFNTFLDPIVQEMNDLECSGQNDPFKHDEFQPKL